MATKPFPAVFNQKVYYGDGWKPFRFSLADGLGNPISLAGATVLMQIKKHAKDITPVKELTHLDGLAISSNSITIDTLVDLDPDTYIYNIKITRAGLRPKTYVKGFITVS